MGEIGNLGDIQFRVNEGKKGITVLSFFDFGKSTEAEYEEHERNGKKSFLEFIDPGLDEVTLTIYADARYRIKPLSVKNKLFAYKNKGSVVPLVLGGRKVGAGNYVITGIQENNVEFSNSGKPVRIQFSVTLKEYHKKKKTVKKKETGKKTNPTEKKKSKETKTTKQKGYTTYTIKKGDTLAAIAKKYYGKGSDFLKIYKANKGIIKNPDMIYAGQKIKIPK